MSLPRVMTQVDLDTLEAYSRLPRITAWPITARRQRRERRSYNRGRREWLRDIGRAARRHLRLDLVPDYDDEDFPF